MWIFGGCVPEHWQPLLSASLLLGGQLSSRWDRRMAGRLFSSPDEFLVTSVMLGFNELWMERHSVLMKSATRNRKGRRVVAVNPASWLHIPFFSNFRAPTSTRQREDLAEDYLRWCALTMLVGWRECHPACEKKPALVVLQRFCFVAAGGREWKGGGAVG